MFQKVSGVEENYEKDEGIMIFCREFSVSHTEKNRGANFCVSEISGIVNVMNKRGVSRLSVGKFLSHSTRRLCG